MLSSRILLPSLCALLLLTCVWNAAAGEVTNLRCEYRVNPLGIDAEKPRLSWELDGEIRTKGERQSLERGQRQTAWQVLVASTYELLQQDKGDMWNSGKVSGDQSIQVAYAGKPLASGQQYHWRVRVWGGDGKEFGCGGPATWTMGLIKEEDWTAQWITTTNLAPPTPMSGGTLKILKATYVAKDGSGSADVTERVAAKVANGTLSLEVKADQLGGDPAPNRVKELRVDYELNGVAGRASAADFRTLILPPPIASLPTPLDAPHVRRCFTLDAMPSSALASVNVLGFYELYVNGSKVGNDVLSPALSNYHKRSLYVTHDLRPYLRKGKNCIGLWLSRGWYWKALDGRKNPAVQHEAAIARLQLDLLVDGKPVRIGTDDAWRCIASGRSILGTWSWNQMGGEQVDARLEVPRWADAATDDSAWYAVKVVPAPRIPAEAQRCPPTTVIKTLPAIAVVTKPVGKAQRHEVDFGCNLTGWLRLRLRGLKAGDEITIRYSDKKGHAPMQQYNHIDRFISAGRAEEEFCSKFNYHGFRWALIEGLPTAPLVEDAQALAIAADWEVCGDFSCSSELFNRMHAVNLWTVLALSQSGFLSDCPHRERLGYGDGQVSIESCIMNFRMAPFYDKWATDWCDGADEKTGYLPHTAPQYKAGGGGPAWGGSAQALTWRNHLYYADTRIVARNYETCRRHVEAMEARAKDGIVRAFGGEWDFIGDWVPPDRGMDSGKPPPKNAAEFFNNCYRLCLREQLAVMAEQLGRADEAKACRAEIVRLRPLIHAAFYDEQKQIYALDEQSYQLMPLMTGVVPDALRPIIMKKLEDGIRVKRKGHLDTGMLGTYFLIQYLQEIDRNDLLFEVINQTSYPGWGHMLKQGATTWWEQWNAHWSQIHSCFTSLDSWFYQGLAGIRPDPAAPGFKHIIIKPAIVGDLTGRTRTAPAEDAPVQRLRLALASCQHYEQGAFAAHREIAARDLDLVLFVGDYIYESSNPRYRLRAHEGPVPKTLAAYRARHATYKLDADLRAAHAAHPWLMTWDDHEVENDYAGDHGLGGQTPQQFLQRRAAAYKAYFEHMPVAPAMAPQGAAMRIHARHTWGRLAELWTLDNRQYRSLQACADAGGGGRVLSGCDALEDPSRSMFGPAQERWLADGLAASTRQWKLLGQATQISPSAIDTPLGRRLYSDGWDGYPQARERLLRAIADPGVTDVVCLGGDVHRHVAANLRLRPNDARSPIVASEFVTSSITSRGLSEAGMALVRSSNPDIVHGRGDERGYALIEVTPGDASCEFRATAFPVLNDARLHTQARFSVDAGHAGAQRG